MIDHWFSAIYNNRVIQFKFHPQLNKKFSHNCWITTKNGEELLVNIDEMVFGEYEYLNRKINEETISRL